MFDGDDDLKQKLRDFLDDEIDEIKQNKIRFFALIFSFIISLSLLFMGDSDGEKIEVNNTAQIEETAEDTEKKDVEDDEKISNKKVISVKKAHEESNGTKVVAVIGANSDELYVGDPFQSYEEKPAKIQPEDSKNVTIPQQVPIIPPIVPAQPPTNSAQLPDLPPIPYVVPKITEVAMELPKSVEKEFILTGTAINFDEKSAIIKKVSPTQDKNTPEVNLIVSVGDSLDGHQIVDITPSAVIFDDGQKINSNYLGENISISTNKNDAEIPAIPTNYAEIPVEAADFPERDVPILPDSIENYDENSPEKDIPKVEENALSASVSLESEEIPVKIEDTSFDLNSGTTEKISELATDTPNVADSFEDNPDTSENSLTAPDIPLDLQDGSFISSDSSP